MEFATRLQPGTVPARLAPMVDETDIGGTAREFPPTRWTLILSTRDGDGRRRAAVETLFAAYWKPMYFYARRKGLPVEEAKDAVQALFAQLLERDFPARLDPARGRFRAYLRTALDHLLINFHESRSAQKRGGGAPVLSLDVEGAERDVAGAPADPAAAFEREWAVGVMERALAALRREFETGARRGPFDVFVKCFQPGEAPSCEQGAKDCGMSVPQFKAFLHRTRVRFRELVRGEVSDTMTDAREADGEVAELIKTLAGG